jgi:hypothetical protein
VTPPAPTPWLWYEDAAVFPEILVPWKHFVPVEADLSDLVQRVRAPPLYSRKHLHPRLPALFLGRRSAA